VEEEKEGKKRRKEEERWSRETAWINGRGEK